MRWLLASLLIAIVLIEHTWIWSLAHLLFFFLFMWILVEKFQRVCVDWIKSWHVLRWLLIPILVFHIFFTPGEIVWVGLALPISYEGLTLGLHLSLKLYEMFMCALLLGRLLPMRLWLESLSNIRILQHYLIPYLRLMPMMLHRVPILVRRTYQVWYLEPKKVKTLAHYMTELVMAVEKDSIRRAKYVWLAWDNPKVMGMAVQKQLIDSHLGYLACLLIFYVGCEFGVRYLWN